MDLFSEKEVGLARAEIELGAGIAGGAGGGDPFGHQLPKFRGNPFQPAFHRAHDRDDYEEEEEKLDEGLARFVVQKMLSSPHILYSTAGVCGLTTRLRV